MERFLVFAMLACLAGGGSLLFQGVKPTPPNPGVGVQIATDGAYRDGLFIGKLRRDTQARMLPPVGRWSTPQDRAAFLQGYRQGLGEENSGK